MTYERPVFYYANGTTFFANFFGIPILNFVPGTPLSPLGVKTVTGSVLEWDGAIINDPFPLLLDSTLWAYDRVDYPASGLDMAGSMQYGVDYIVDQVLLTDVGTPFAIGGYSQGAAVASMVYNECRQGRLVERRSDLRAVVNFGNPMRQAGRTFPGSSGYSGAFDIPNSTSGSHGCFPVRLQNTEEFVWEFTMPNEVVTGVGDSYAGQLFVTAAGKFLANDLVGALVTVLSNASGLFGLGGKTVADLVVAAAEAVDVVNLLTDLIVPLPGGGHVMYPFFPPPNADGSIPESGDTCYQLAAKYLNSIGQQIYDQINPSIPAPTAPPSYSWFSNLPVG